MASLLRQLTVQQPGRIFFRASILKLQESNIFLVPVRGAAVGKKGAGGGKAGGGAKAKKILDVETVCPLPQQSPINDVTAIKGKGDKECVTISLKA